MHAQAYVRKPKQTLPTPPPPHSTVLAVAGEDYCIVAASTRMSAGFDIMTRNSSKILKL